MPGLGFIARESISRDELEKLIDDGIAPDDLAKEIQRRIDDKQGYAWEYATAK